ncbi:protein ENHANCED PSEUDOMONAS SUSCEPTIBILITY 1-like [Cicer arietinum]|uniref:Protein ENHANCED PSEUDOMONAS SUSCEPTIBILTY 1-like n=1 Tax=Cicer arietinum TaxID=3827 RepID=A0A1S2YWK6_CICAR|nr:protein ENHANCED PSEUDOMONAS SUSCEPTIBILTY 1-like [Cicer arietinum]
MSSVQVISTTTIYAPNHNLGNNSTDQEIDLTPWDLQFLPFGVNQKGLLYHHPKELNTSNQIHHLKHSLSTTLDFFPPFTGRLKITEHRDNTISCSITCNNEGALFLHAIAKNTSVADILEPTYLPPILHSFFPLNGVKNYQGTSQPLLAVQVTELLDGIFIGFTINHVVVDGKSIWHFVNSWAEISKGCLKTSKLPTFERWFPNNIIQRPIRFPFTIEQQNNNSNNKGEDQNLNPPERLFHFTKENIAKLKLKANIEVGTKKLSSLQALFTHIWRSIIRSKLLEPQEEVKYMVVIGIRPRLVPALQEDYFGNAMIICGVTMKVGELLEEGGLGKSAWEMNKMIALHSDEKLKKHYETWSKTPTFITPGSVANSNTLVTSSSPWFDVYGNDFGWGKPVGVRSGGANKKNGKISVFAGVEEGSMDLEVCLPYEILEAIGNDPEFMAFVSI